MAAKVLDAKLVNVQKEIDKKKYGRMCLRKEKV